MGSSISFFASNQDQLDLEAYARSIGLYVLDFFINREVTPNPADGPGCLFSKYPIEHLHPYGDPPIQIAEVIDPMLSVRRAYYKDGYLVLGAVRWNNDNKKVGAEILPYYRKIQRWIRKNWSKYGDFYMGPEASKLVEKGAQRVNFHPDHTPTLRFVDTSKPIVR